MTRNLRRLSIPGTHNLRDIGGYPTPDGSTRWQTLFRSDALHRLGEPGRDALRELGVTLVLDLREDWESTAAPDALDGVGHTAAHVPIYDGTLDMALAGADLEELYRRMLDHNGVGLTQAVRRIATADPEPVLVHCTAGKDRTGLVIALILLTVGVAECDVVADYAMSEPLLRGEWLAYAQRALIPEHLSPGFDTDLMCASPADAMRGALGHLRWTYGDARDYLITHGMSEDELTALRRRLLA